MEHETCSNLTVTLLLLVMQGRDASAGEDDREPIDALEIFEVA